MNKQLLITSDKLYDKMKMELENFKSELRSKPPDEIIQSAYELVTKEDILTVFEIEENFELQDYKALLKTKKPLEYLYQEWLEYDGSSMDMIRDSVNLAIEKQIEHLKTKSEKDKDYR